MLKIRIAAVDGWKEKIQNFKELLEMKVKETFDSGLYMLKFHLLDSIMELFDGFGSLVILDCSPFEKLNMHIKHAYRST